MYDRVNTQLEDVEAMAEQTRKIVLASTNNEPTKNCFKNGWSTFHF